ncbi:MAG TPA: sigma 54-interacting transcriptional regulator [Gemmatimonadales bacterium]|nr:sigma 54-interacting transcriptional regulator [Gemmatimonadales bacterium]
MTARPSNPGTVLQLPSALVAEHEIIGTSRATRAVVELMERCARTLLPVLIVGATGTGKELVARGIHRLSGRRGEFVEVDCGALPSTMTEGLLFGHRRGAFTDAREHRAGFVEGAHRGTLFLDEITNLSLGGQGALLRVLETGEVRRLGESDKRPVDLRVVAAAQDGLQSQLTSGAFRRDLFHRLAGLIIHLEPLARRPDDVLPLADHFARRSGTALGIGAAGVLRSHAWPGNVRELRRVIERASMLAEGSVLDGVLLAEAIRLGRLSDASGESVKRQMPAEDQRWADLVAVCERHGWRDAELIATELGVHRTTLFRLLRKAGLSLRR